MKVRELYQWALMVVYETTDANHCLFYILKTESYQYKTMNRIVLLLRLRVHHDTGRSPVRLFCQIQFHVHRHDSENSRNHHLHRGDHYVPYMSPS